MYSYFGVMSYESAPQGKTISEQYVASFLLSKNKLTGRDLLYGIKHIEHEYHFYFNRFM